MYILRFDHRVPFLKNLFNVAPGDLPDDDQRLQISDLKGLVYEGLCQALDEGVARESVVIVIDEEFGAKIARQSKEAGIPVAISVERSGRDEFELEYGDDFARHIEDLDPNFIKALARYNPAGDAELNHRQRERLVTLSKWADAEGRKWIFELLIPPTRDQLERSNGDVATFEREVLPQLLIETVASLQDAGVRPAVWMIPGLATRSDYESAAHQVLAESHGEVVCVVLGQGPDAERIRDWVRVAGEAKGFGGLAVAQTIWLPILKDFSAKNIDRASARTRIARSFIEVVSLYDEHVLTRYS